MKRKIISVLLALALAPGIVAVPMAGTVEANGLHVSGVADGDYIHFGGWDWIILDNTTGYVILKDASSIPKQTDPVWMCGPFEDHCRAFDYEYEKVDARQEWDTNGRVASLNEWLNGTFYNDLGDDKAFVADGSWQIEAGHPDASGDAYIWTGKIALLTKTEFESYRVNGPNLHATSTKAINYTSPDPHMPTPPGTSLSWWLLTPSTTHVFGMYAVNPANLVTDNAGAINKQVRPTLYLTSGLTTSGGDGSSENPFMVVKPAPTEVWIDNNWTSQDDVDPGLFWGWDAFATIQAGIDEVASGGTINVAAGTYPGGTNPKWAIYIDKPITLLGAQAGVDARNRSGAESIINATGYGVGIYIVGEGDHTVIDGFEVKNSGYVDERGAGIGLEDGADYVTIRNTYVHSNNNQGIQSFLRNSSLQINNHILIEKCRLEGNGDSGVKVYGSSDVTVQDNLFRDNGAFGVLVWDYRTVEGYVLDDVQILRNQFSNNCDNIKLDGGETNGIITNAVVAFNEIRSGQRGVYLKWNVTSPQVYNNEFEDNDVQVDDKSGGLDIGAVLANNTFDRAVTVDRPGDSLLHTIWSSIQDAINAATTGDTINVTAGTYKERITIEKELVIQSTDEAENTIIDGNGVGNNVVNIWHKNVTFEGFTVTNPTLGAYADAGGIYVQDPKNLDALLVNNVHVLNNIVEATKDAFQGTSSYGPAGIVIGPSSNVTVSGNIIRNLHNCPDVETDHTTGINVWGNDAASRPFNIVISDNVISDTDDYGILLEYAHNVRIENNSITECEVGIYLNPFSGATVSDVTVSGNTVDRNEVGICTETGAVNGNTIHFNNITGNIYHGVKNNGNEALDATNNWWGDATGPDHATNPTGQGDAVSDNVAYSPWLYHAYPAPSVITSDASSVTSTSATLNGNLNSLGTASSVAVSFEWGETTEYGNTATVTASPLSQAGAFSATISGLSAGTIYHFRAVAVGDGTSYGDDLTVEVITYQITDLAAGNPTQNSIDLTWTTPEAGANAFSYFDVRYSTATITSDNWGGVVRATGEPAPVAGISQGMKVKGLDSDTTYYFAVKLVDEEGLVGLLSNIASKTTLAAPPIDETSPGQIIDLEASAGSPATTRIVLSWTAPGDDEDTGTATSYEICRSASAITEANWGSATIIYNNIVPQAAGGSESFVVSRLTPDTTYYFAIQAKDEAGNTSPTSNSPSITTGANSPTVTGISPASGDNSQARMLTIDGTNFVEGTNVVRLVSDDNTFDLTNVTYASLTRLTADVATGAPTGTYKVRVINDNGTSELSSATYEVTQAPTPLPVVTNLIPQMAASGSAVSGVQIFGENLTGATAVSFGDTAASNVTVISDTKITADAPGLSAGEYDVRVTTPAAGANEVSGVKFVVSDPVAITVDTTEDTTTSEVVTLDTPVIPVQLTLTTDTSETATQATDTDAEIEVVIPPGTTVTDSEGNAYTGNINPPRVVKPDESVLTDLSDDAVVIEMGNPEETINFDQDFVVTVTITAPVQPVIWYFNKDTQAYELAGKTGTKDGVDYIPGGTKLGQENSTYTMGLLLDHMSSYISGVKPHITSAPATATAGSTFTITGTNFHPTAAEVYFSGTAGTIVSRTSTTQIVARFPTAGSYTLKVENPDKLSDTTSITLTTPPLSPSVTTGDATSVTITSATLNGSLDGLGTASSVAVSFEWGTTTGYGNETTPQAMTSTGPFSSSLSGLTPDTTYHFRAKAVGDSTSYGVDRSFTTGAIPTIPPAVTNSTGASSITHNSARLNGEVTDTGGENPTVHVYWGDNDGGTTLGSWDNDINLGAKGDGTFYTDITGLSPDTTYYYRCYAVNSGGSDWANSTAQFTTQVVAPTVQTYNPADGATAVATNANLVLTFDDNMVKGTGNITIKKHSDDSTFETIDVTTAKVTISGTQVTINPTGTFASETEYYVLIDDTCFDDTSGNSYAGIADKTTWNFTSADTVAPTVISYDPADGATGVATDANLVITFSEVVDVETGDITIKKSVGDTVFETITLPDAKVSGTGTDTITINPAGTFNGGTGYYVLIDDTCFDDTSGNSYAGIADKTTWNFTSADTVAPTVTSYDPADGATAVATNANLVLTFDDNMVKGTGNITIKKHSDDSTFETIDVTTAKVTISGIQVTINPTGTFAGETEYYVLIDATALDDDAGNSYAGILDKDTWNFTTVTAPPPTGGGGGGGAPHRPSVLTIDMLGEIVIAEIKSDGTLLESYVPTDPSGNVILGLDSGTKIICSDNQVPERLEVSLSAEPPPVPEGIAAVSPIYDLTAYISGGVPRPVTFDPPVRLQINYELEEVPENVLSVFIACHDEEQGWTQLEPPSGFVAAVGTAGAQVSHFTPFAVMVDLAALPLPARFEIRNLDINPNQVMAGESIIISAQLVNIGGLSGEHTLMVNVEGLLDTSRVIRLDPGQSQIITFTVTPGSPGSYRVEIDDLRGNFVVRAIPTPPIPTPPAPTPAAEAGVYGWLIAIISAGAAIAAWAFIVRRKRLQRAGVVKKPSKPTPSAFRISNLKITPRRVKPGGSVTIISEATNTGPVTGSYSLVLKIKGMVEAVKEITLGPGQSQKVAFTILKDKPGVYDADLEGLKGSFTVEER